MVQPKELGDDKIGPNNRIMYRLTSLYNSITQTNPGIDIFHQSISTSKLKINQMLWSTHYPLPLPPPTPTPCTIRFPLPPSLGPDSEN